MSKFGVERILYYCPKLNKKVLLFLDYSTIMNDKMYTALELESSSKWRCTSGTENHCYRCNGNHLLHDALREKAAI